MLQSCDFFLVENFISIRGEKTTYDSSVVNFSYEIMVKIFGVSEFKI